MPPAPSALTTLPGPTRTHTGSAGTLLEISTDGVAPHERLEFWRMAHMDRMALKAASNEARPFEGRVRRILGTESHLMEHASDALVATRSKAQCQRDGIDYVSVNLMLECGTSMVDHGTQRRITTGALYFIDSARPVEMRHPRHHLISIFLPRRNVAQAIGAQPGPLTASLQARTGMGAVLQSHMRMLAAQAAVMTPQQRVVSVAACSDMALAVLQAAHQGVVDAEQFSDGLYDGARRLILQLCGDSQLTPEAIAARLGCSRASLYRLFLKHGQKVSALIWATRVQLAHDMISSGRHAALSLAEIAFHSGFVDQATFNRMFKRRYGVTPGDVRAANSVRAGVQAAAKLLAMPARSSASPPAARL